MTKQKDQTDAPAEAPALSAAQLRGLRHLQRGAGEVCMLMSAHPRYSNLFLSEAMSLITPPILLNQYRIIRNKQDRTIGFVAWAKVSGEVHQRLRQGVLKLQSADWQSGETVVVMELIAPSHKAGAGILHAIQQAHFADEAVWVIDGDGENERKLKRFLPMHESDVPEIKTLQ